MRTGGASKAGRPRDPGSGGLFVRRFFQLAIDPQLDPSDGKQLQPGFGLAADDPVANTELPFPRARGGGCDGVFDALVNHTNNLATASRIQVGLVT